MNFLEHQNPDSKFSEDNHHLRNGYDHVVSCLGFKFDFDIFAGTSIRRDGGKYPKIDHKYQSVDEENIYFAGQCVTGNSFLMFLKRKRLLITA